MPYDFLGYLGKLRFVEKFVEGAALLTAPSHQNLEAGAQDISESDQTSLQNNSSEIARVR